MRQVTLNRKTITRQPGLTSYVLDISVASTIGVPREIFVMQRVKKYDGTLDDSFYTVCSPTHIEDFQVNVPAADTGYFRVDHFQLVSSAPEFLEYAWTSVVEDVQKLCTDLDAMDILDQQDSTTVTSEDTVYSPIPAPYRINGVVDLALNVASGTVAGLNLPITPSTVILTVAKPADGLNIFAVLVEGSLTADGFAFELSAMTDSLGYKLNYTIIQ